MGCCSSQLLDNEANQDLDNFVPTGGNKPLRKKSLSWTADAPLNFEQLKAKRDEFWETAPTYEGRREIWERLRTACETEDLTQAQSIVDSLRLSVPTGHLSDGCYDELGNCYIIPVYCFTEPTNFVRPSSDSTIKHSITDSNPGYELLDKKGPYSTPIPTITITEHTESEPKEEPLYVPPTSTSSAKNGGEELVVRLSTGKDIRVKAHPTDTMEVIKQRVCSAEQIEPSTVNVRFFYMGKILDINATIADTKVPTGGVIQALVVLI
ncbi:hypothetical protein K7432_009132 [Basidiobolus ranarum]|uniref:Ubiquitin-like domain-containing protein n=1 Tax=Basidiobolus ranarum TaxID=34480 RepID=A0ABR2VYE8_9FUNG